MKKYLGDLAAFWLGFSITVFTDLDFRNWEFYVIVFPVITLYVLDKELNNK